jgi:hypothetical protein
LAASLVPAVRPARDLLHDMVELLPAGVVSLINPLVYANAGALGHASYRRFLFWANAARDVVQPPVRLGHYGPQTYIDGSGPFHVLTGDTLVAEHIIPGFDQLASNHLYMLGQRDRAVDVATPCVLACHPGTRVWSHWLIDTLPKILLAEQAFPNRFSFVVPASITDPDSSNFLVRSILESLAAYGIEFRRLLRLREGVFYRFGALFDVVDMHGDGVHPGVLRALRTLKTPPPFRGRYRVTASLRGPGELRPITNVAELAPVLRAHNAAQLDPGSTPFLDKVRAFRDSDVIIGDLGSNLAVAIYASPGAGIVTLGPSNWRDNYFAQYFQRLGAYHADVRGMPLPKPGDAPGHSAHVIDTSHFDAGILAAIQAAAAPPAPGSIEVDGRPIARSMGRVLLRIEFGVNGNAAPFQRGAFSPPEARHTWSIGPTCALVVPGFAATHIADLWLEIKGIGFIAAPHLVSRVLGVAINGVELAAFDIDELTHVHVWMPSDVVRRHEDLTIEFRHPVCPSPQSMGVSDDARPLGFMFEFVAIREREAVLF